ncbi:aminoglycoside 3'-phosphotransferase [Paenibacillaceae bacterium]|nr:aminoglycoside 3'-phosphotransferase [Paenibacillaceae bacterium]
MKRTEIHFDIDTVPTAFRPYFENAMIYDSSCSENARTLYISGANKLFLKISKQQTLQREADMTAFLHRLHAAPKVVAYESDGEHDYLLLEAAEGEDGTAPMHLGKPAQLAAAFGEYLQMLHTLPTDGCPYSGRTREIVKEAGISEAALATLNELNYTPADQVIIHGDYCLPNIIMDNFVFKGFIDVGFGGIGDRHYDLYWGLWTLQFNLKTDQYNDIFLNAYGRHLIHSDGLAYYTRLAELSD